MARKGAKLGDEQKTYVVQQLAAYETPSDVAAQVKERWGIEISKQAVEAYDPTKWAGRDLAKKWSAAFDLARKAYLEDLDGVPEAHKAVRVKQLARMARQASERGNVVLAADLLAQIAKEVGGAFTNRTELTGKGGGPIQHTELTDDELRTQVVGALDEFRRLQQPGG